MKVRKWTIWNGSTANPRIEGDSISWGENVRVVEESAYSRFQGESELKLRIATDGLREWSDRYAGLQKDYFVVREQLRKSLMELTNRMTVDELAAFTAKINADNVQDIPAVST